jgi:hypothetical protein
MERVEGWENIAEFFPYSEITVRKKFGPEMLATGVVFKSHIGRGKKRVVWSFPSLIKEYISKKQVRDGNV